MKTKREVEDKTESASQAPAPSVVTVRVLPKGDGQISNGEHDPRGGDVVYERGDIFDVREDIALELEDRGFAEIQKTRKPRANNAAVEGDDTPAVEDKAD
jgi:hypothetical protein